MIRAPLDGLVRGEAYTVRWHEISADGHVSNGVFTFGVGVEAPPPTEAVGASGAPGGTTSRAGCSSSPSRS